MEDRQAEIQVVLLNNKPISPLVLVDFNVEEGWVEIEDLTALTLDVTVEPDLTDPTEETDLPTKRLYGQVEVKTIRLDIRSPEK